MLRSISIRYCRVIFQQSYLTQTVFNHRRSISVKVPNAAIKPSLPNLETKDHQTAKGKLKKRFFERFFDYLGKYETVLKSVLPASAVKAFELFSSGTKLLFADMKEFAWTNHVLTSTTNWEKACNTLTRHQLEVGFEMGFFPPVFIVKLPLKLLFFCWLAAYGQSYKGETWQLSHFIVKTHIPATA